MHHVPCIAPTCSPPFAAAATSDAAQFIFVRCRVRPLYPEGDGGVGWRERRREGGVLRKSVPPGRGIPHVQGESNRDYYRVHVFTHTALTSTAILTLTFGAATARERAPRPTVTAATPTTTTTDVAAAAAAATTSRRCPTIATGHHRPALRLSSFFFISMLLFDSCFIFRFYLYHPAFRHFCSSIAAQSFTFSRLLRVFATRLSPLRSSSRSPRYPRHARASDTVLLSRGRARCCRSAAAAIDVGGAFETSKLRYSSSSLPLSLSDWRARARASHPSFLVGLSWFLSRGVTSAVGAEFRK